MLSYMRMLCALLSACAVHAAHACARGTNDTTKGSPVTVTPLGTIRGSWMISRKGRCFEAYRNISYAKPPVGLLRFEAPRPIVKYSKEVNAKEDGPACPQPNIRESPGYIDEDCLKLNVYTPRQNRSNLLPVVVFFTYGGFYVLSGRSDVAGPRYLMDQDLVLVTFNFRLGSLGYISTGDKLAPGNNGFKDMVVVLRWVKKNIAAFGGDPDNVTLLGVGSGSYSVALMMVSPLAKGLFHRAVSISGSPFSQVEIGQDQRDLAVKQAQLVGCPSNTSKVIINCLRKKPWKEIADSVNGFDEFGTGRVLHWTVVVENDFGQERFMPYDPLDAVRSGKMYSVPYIFSQTKDEYSWLANIVLNNATLMKMLNKEFYVYAPKAFMLPEDTLLQAGVLRLKYLGVKLLENDSKSLKNLGQLFGDALIGLSAHRLANLMCQNSKAPVYYYLFDYIGKNSFYKDPITKLPTGVAHHDDLIYLLSMPGLFPDVGLVGADAVMVDRMTTLIYNFAKFGDPNPRPKQPELSQLSWPRMLPSKRSYLRISTNFSVDTDLFEDRFKVWDKLYPAEYSPALQLPLTAANAALNVLRDVDVFGLIGKFF